MAYGGGTFMSQNKTMPGAYIVFASVARASATISDRGVAAAPFELSWGPVGEVREIEQREFIKNSMELFGYPYSAPEMRDLREIFTHATKCFCYRMPTSNAATAVATATGNLTFAVAKYPGKRGNDICVVVTKILNTDTWYVETYVGSTKVDAQTCQHWADLQDNGFVKFVKSVTVEETEYTLTTDTTVAGDGSKTYYNRTGEEGNYTYTAVKTEDLDNEQIGNYYEASTGEVTYALCFTGETVAGNSKQVPNEEVNMTGGADGEIVNDAHDLFISAIEPYAFNTLCCPSDDQTTIKMYVTFTKDMRDNIGSRFQLVCYAPDSSTGADYEGVISLFSRPKDADADPAALTYWLAGAEAAALINNSLTNSKYDGEYEIAVDTKQALLEKHIKNGELVFHNSNGNIVVLTDINSLVTLRENFGSMYQKNQTIRVCDNIANDLASLFVSRYLGIVQNDANGRAAWKNECIKYFRELQRLRAITEFDDDIIEVDIGNEKDEVITYINGLNIVNAMEKLYMTVICR